LFAFSAVCLFAFAMGIAARRRSNVLPLHDENEPEDRRGELN
jgi:hypothetical protein